MVYTGEDDKLTQECYISLFVSHIVNGGIGFTCGDNIARPVHGVFRAKLNICL